MKTKKMVAVSVVALMLFIGVGAALAATLSYPNFPVPRSTTCAAETSQPGNCVDPPANTPYFVWSSLSVLDITSWNYVSSTSWGNPEKLDAMCIAWRESFKKVYNLLDNWNAGYQAENSPARFDYGFMQINSQHISNSNNFDPYWLISSGTSNAAAGYELWSDRGGNFGDWSGTHPLCDNETYEQWEYVSSPTCSFDPPSSTWAYWDDRWVWVWHFGPNYPGDNGDGIAAMFC